MQIKLKKKAQWEGAQHKAGGVHDIDPALAHKLIARGYAEEYAPSEDQNAAAVCE
jgi:hypothetical protein